MDKRVRRVTYKQEDGDDGYCYCVRVDGRPVTNASLTRGEAMRRRDAVEGALKGAGEKLYRQV